MNVEPTPDPDAGVHPDATYRPFYVGSRVKELRRDAPTIALEVAGDRRMDVGGCSKCGEEIWVNRSALADLIDGGVSGQVDFYCSECAEKVQGWRRRQMPRHMRRARAHNN